jgi:hypothetical protein
MTVIISEVYCETIMQDNTSKENYACAVAIICHQGKYYEKW